MSRGPLEYILIEFPDNRFSGKIVPALHELVTNDVIRIVDLIFIRKDGGGKVDFYELSALEPEVAAPFAMLDGEVNGLLNETDIELAAQALRPNGSAAVLVWENSWAARFISAVTEANGRVLAHERIPGEVFDEAMAALAQGALTTTEM